jgi:isopentenyldiphosphate isomerase
MNDQMLILCDDFGNPTGEYAPKALCHLGEGRRHLAITILLSNENGEVLLQKRKHELFDGVWDFTAATHLLHHPDGSNESVDDAATRCLREEYQIGTVRLSVSGAFVYFARYGDRCENEYCLPLVGEFNGRFSLNPKVGYEAKWVPRNEFFADVERSPEVYSPWAVEGVKVLRISV